MSDELSAARRVLARLSPAAFVAALTEDERSQLRVALLDESMRVVTLQPRGEARIRNGTDAPIVVAYSRTDDSRVVYQDPEPARDFVSRGDGPLHWVPAWGYLRGEVHALDADVTACGLSLRPGRTFRAATSDEDFGAGVLPSGEGEGRCRRCWGSFRSAGGAFVLGDHVRHATAVDLGVGVVTAPEEGETPPDGTVLVAWPGGGTGFYDPRFLVPA